MGGVSDGGGSAPSVTVSASPGDTRRDLSLYPAPTVALLPVASALRPCPKPGYGLAASGSLAGYVTGARSTPHLSVSASVRCCMPRRQPREAGGGMAPGHRAAGRVNVCIMPA